jgi:GNAT superfamily N-acetyltransferase
MYSTLIRHADDDDLPELPVIAASAGAAFADVAGLEQVASDPGLDLAALQHAFDTGEVWVAQALEDPLFGELVAFAIIRRVGGAMHLVEMSVRREVQGRGIGRALLSAVLESALEAGCTTATLTTFKDVPWNAPFYASMGFQEVGGGNMPDHLRDALAAEAARGMLPMDRRCAMQLTLGRTA